MPLSTRIFKRLPLVLSLYLLPMAAISMLFAMGPSTPAPTRPATPSAPSTSPALADAYHDSIAPLVSKYCLTCHQGQTPKGDVNLQFSTTQDVQQRLNDDPKLFDRMAQ